MDTSDHVMLSTGIEKYYTDHFTVSRETSDGSWGSDTLGVVIEGYGKIQITGGGKAVSNGKRTVTNVATLFCPDTIGIEYGDILDFSGKSFRVILCQPNLGISGFGHHQEVALEYYDGTKD